MKPEARDPQAPVVASERARAEWLSALFDGECDTGQAADVLGTRSGAEDRAAWDAYRCIGDALRAQASATPTAADPAFVRAVMQRVAAESQPKPQQWAEVTPLLQGTSAPSANDAVFRWKMVAGVATLAAVVALAWQIGAVPGAGGGGAQLAQGQSPAMVASTPSEAVVETPAGVVVRDPQLEELLAAHRQWGGASALQAPAGFLRAASYDVSTR